MGHRSQGPTPRQLEALRLMVDPLMRSPIPGRPPTFRELRDALGVTSLNTVHGLLESLVAKGLLEKPKQHGSYWPTVSGVACVHAARDGAASALDCAPTRRGER